MPSPVGHALAGASVWLLLLEPRQLNRGEALASGLPGNGGRFVLLAAAVAALPDADLLVSGFHRHATHGLGTTLIVFIVTMAVTGWVTGRRAWRLATALALAHASHIALDWLGTDRFPPAGIQALWPVSTRFYLSGWDWFPPTERRLLANPQAFTINLRALMFELATLGTLTVVALWQARWRARAT